jgi:hypothetical protein
MSKMNSWMSLADGSAEKRGRGQGVEKVEGAGEGAGAGVIGDAVVYDKGVVDALGVAGGGSSEDILICPVMACLPFFLVDGCPKIELATSKSPPVSITSADAARATAARRGGSGVPRSLSSDQSPVSDMILQLVRLNHRDFQKRKVVVRGQEAMILIFPVMDCLPLFLVGVRVPKIELVTSKSPPVSITSADAAHAISARRGGSGVSLSLSSDQSPLSDMIFLVDCTFHTKIQKRKVVVRGQEGMHR